MPKSGKKMEQKSQLKSLVTIFALLLMILTIFHPCQAHSHYLQIAPSPAVSGSGVPIGHMRSGGKRMRGGSFPAKCHSKCNQCKPCVPVQVSVRALTLEDNEYYPLVWKCMCRHFVFSP
ncbi:hypothetical protein I3760_05G017700 [Carya illinoinensis]|nr:hypothetical protein I3760_05G017700 [Carya illinoinensis]